MPSSLDYDVFFSAMSDFPLRDFGDSVPYLCDVGRSSDSISLFSDFSTDESDSTGVSSGNFSSYGYSRFSFFTVSSLLLRHAYGVYFCHAIYRECVGNVPVLCLFCAYRYLFVFVYRVEVSLVRFLWEKGSYGAFRVGERSISLVLGFPIRSVLCDVLRVYRALSLLPRPILQARVDGFYLGVFRSTTMRVHFAARYAVWPLPMGACYFGRASMVVRHGLYHDEEDEDSRVDDRVDSHGVHFVACYKGGKYATLGGDSNRSFFVGHPRVFGETTTSSRGSRVRVYLVGRLCSFCGAFYHAHPLCGDQVWGGLWVKVSSVKGVTSVLGDHAYQYDCRARASSGSQGKLLMLLHGRSRVFGFLFRHGVSLVRDAYAFRDGFLYVRLVTTITFVCVRAPTGSRLVTVFRNGYGSPSISNGRRAVRYSYLVFRKGVSISTYVVFAVKRLTFCVGLLRWVVLNGRVFSVAICLACEVYIFRSSFSSLSLLTVLPEVPFAGRPRISPPGHLTDSATSLVTAPMNASLSCFDSCATEHETIESAQLVLFIFRPLLISFGDTSVSSGFSDA